MSHALALAGIAAGGIAGGFVCGLAGFGTALTAIGVWLQILPPPVVAMLVVICTATAQATSLPAVWKAVELRRVVPFLIPGLIAVPVGAWLLHVLDPRLVRLGVGVLLVVYSTFLLLRRPGGEMRWGGRPADAAVGFIGGTLGGLIGLSGAVPTLWATLRGWNKLESRSVFQCFNLAVALLALATHAWSGMLTVPVLRAALVAVPAVLVGTRLGVRAWYRLGERGFRRMILLLLGISGLLLVKAALV